jgi:hypothetical protein
MINHARLLIDITTQEFGYTYKLDRTTVMVGAPSMLAMSTIPASAVASFFNLGSLQLLYLCSRGGV